MKNKHFIQNVLKEILENLDADEKVISQYFSPNYIQHVDGHTLNYDEFVQHMKKQKSILRSVKVTIDHCVAEENGVSTVHRVEAIKKDGRKLIVKVVAYFKLENGKITLCDELTKLLTGEKEDQDIGSMR
ncbi:MAG: nuclear transport factor 2 family protein [Chlamydiae bacterium]|nr:nuclear transport factor 2 family protein [Chlamydiota bacterium]